MDDPKLTILLPCLNDWDCAELLLKNLDSELVKKNLPSVRACIVDDGSNDIENAWLNKEQFQKISEINLLFLNKTMGHQKALLLGLEHLISQSAPFDYCLTMDIDGEDTPEDAILMWENTIKNRYDLLVASRVKRNEAIPFQLAYRAYKILFFLFTGKQISFGNFMIMKQSIAAQLTQSKNAESHLAGSILKLNILPSKHPVTKGHRYFGKSKLSTWGHVSHAIKSMALFSSTMRFRIVSFLFLLLFFISLAFFL